jgi:hypothetical protein
MMALLPSEATSRVEHIASDFMLDSREIAQKIKDRGVEKVDAIFFYSYFQPAPGEGATAWSNAEELVRVNSMSELGFILSAPISSIHVSEKKQCWSNLWFMKLISDFAYN